MYQYFGHTWSYSKCSHMWLWQLLQGGQNMVVAVVAAYGTASFLKFDTSTYGGPPLAPAEFLNIRYRTVQLQLAVAIYSQGWGLENDKCFPRVHVLLSTSMCINVKRILKYFQKNLDVNQNINCHPIDYKDTAELFQVGKCINNGKYSPLCQRRWGKVIPMFITDMGTVQNLPQPRFL